MDSMEIGKVIDKVVEKVGVAADALQPLAEETVRQVSVRGLTQAITAAVTCVIVVSFLFWIFYACARRAKFLATRGKNDDEQLLPSIVGSVFAAFGMVITISTFGNLVIDGLNAWVAPIPTILGL